MEKEGEERRDGLSGGWDERWRKREKEKIENGRKDLKIKMMGNRG